MGVKRCGKKDARQVLLDAHLDEVGFLVADTTRAFYCPLGGIDPRFCPTES